MAKKTKKEAYLTKNFICIQDEQGERTYYPKTQKNIEDAKSICGSVRKGRNSKKIVEQKGGQHEN